MSKKIVHVVGTGTIGEPLIGLLCDFKEQLGVYSYGKLHDLFLTVL